MHINMCQHVFFLFSFAVVPILLVGNKKDLYRDPETRFRLSEFGEEPINTVEGLAMAKKINAYSYLEISVQLNAGVREVLDFAARAALQKQKKSGLSCFFSQ